MEVTTAKDFERFLRINSERIDISRFKPMSGKDLTDVLGLTIKRDEENKIVTFLCALSRHLGEFKN